MKKDKPNVIYKGQKNDAIKALEYEFLVLSWVTNDKFHIWYYPETANKKLNAGIEIETYFIPIVQFESLPKPMITLSPDDQKKNNFL